MCPECSKSKKVLLVKALHANFISISQICDDDVQVKFTKTNCLVVDKDGNNLMKGTLSLNNCYLVDVPTGDIQCLLTKQAELNLWHQKTGHSNIKNLFKVARQGIVRGFPMISGSADLVYKECQIGKHIKVVSKGTDCTNTNNKLELFHMDLMGPMQTESLGGICFALVVDDFSRFTLSKLLQEKSGTVAAIVELVVQLQSEKEIKLKAIRSDHGREFENSELTHFCIKNGIKHPFSAPIIAPTK